MITYDEVLADLKAIVAEVGEDHVYELPPNTSGTECLYVHTAADGTHTPGCLVGVWLARRGVDLDELAQWENATAEEFVPRVLADPVENRALHLLRAVQLYQDRREPWGKALIEGQTSNDLVDWVNAPWSPDNEDY